MMRFSALVCLFAVLAASATASAQGMVTSGTATLDFTSLTNTGGYSADLETADGTDHLFSLGVWYRIGATGGETRLEMPTSETYVANVATFTYTDVDATGLDLVVVATLTEPSAGQAAVAFTVNATNTTSASMDVEIFAYGDFEADGTSRSDSATLMSPLPNPAILVTDAGATVTFAGTAVDSFQVLDFPALRNQLNDGMTTTLDGTGLPFVDDDWTAAYAWTRTLAAAASTMVGFGATAAEAPTGDAGVMMGTDAGPMTGTDAGPMTGTDAGPMTGTDAGTMMGTDAGTMMDTDGGTMMGTDAGTMMESDAGTMMGTDGGTMMGTDAGTMMGTDAGTTMGADASTGTDAGTGTVDDGGCSCRVQSGADNGRGALAGLFVLGAFWLRRRRA